MTSHPFSSALVLLRRTAGMTQVDLAATLGISQGSLANVEAGKRRLKDEHSKVIADIFGRTDDERAALLRRLRTLALVQRNPELEELLTPAPAAAFRGDYPPREGLDEINERVRAYPGGVLAVSCRLAIPLEDLQAIRLGDQPISADLLDRLAQLLGADPVNWFNQTGYIPKPVLELMRVDTTVHRFFVTLGRMAETDPDKVLELSRRWRDPASGHS